MAASAVSRERGGIGSAAEAPLDALPGFRRRILIEPGAGSVGAELEDDYHRMAVTIAHENGIATAVSATMARSPWTTCPGAERQLPLSFVGRPLAGFGIVGERARNCTHLHDLALLAAAHAGDAAPTVIDILASDPVDGVKRAELRRNGATVLRWRLEGNRIVAPAAIAGRGLRELGDWIAGLDADGREAARLLRWGTMISGGRAIVVEKDTKQLPQGACYTFQPERFARAARSGAILDLSGLHPGPLADRSTAAPTASQHAR